VFWEIKGGGAEVAARYVLLLWRICILPFAVALGLGIAHIAVCGGEWWDRPIGKGTWMQRTIAVLYVTGCGRLGMLGARRGPEDGIMLTGGRVGIHSGGQVELGAKEGEAGVRGFFLFDWRGFDSMAPCPQERDI
jgi:hypothetical protein